MDKRILITTAMTKNGEARLIYAESTEAVEYSRMLHALSVTTTAVLGRCLTAASMMGKMQKGENDSLTLRIVADGPAGNIVCVSDSCGNVRGYIDDANAELPEKANGKIDVGGAVGNGNLYIIKDIGLKEPYSGSTPLVSGEIAEDVTRYYAVSEQTPTACALGVRVEPDYKCSASGGVILQLLPGCTDETAAILEKNVAGVMPISDMIHNKMSAMEIIEAFFYGLEYEILEESTAEYKCNCSREKYYKGIKSLGKEAVSEMINDNEPIVARCGFCETDYCFEISDLKSMLE